MHQPKRRGSGGGIASYPTPYQQTICLRRHPIDLKTLNATTPDLGPGRGATEVARALGGRFQLFPNGKSGEPPHNDILV